MRPKQAAELLKLNIELDIPTMLWGPPGIGKSRIGYQTADTLEMAMADVRLSQLDPVDLRGIPFVATVDETGVKLTRWAIADFIARLAERPTLLFLDEINSSAQATQAAAYQLVLDRKLGDFALPEHTRIIAAGNNEGDGAIVNRMSSALRNRLAHIDMETHLDDVCNYFIDIGLPPQIIGFLRFRSKLLNEFEDKNSRNLKAFATPRGWERLGHSIEKRPDMDEEILFYHAASIVGEGSATEFMAFNKYHQNMPNPDMILMNPKTAEVPEEPATLYALSTTLATKATQENMDRVIEYTLRMPAEFQVLLVSDAGRRDKQVTYTPAFNKWVSKNADVVL